MYVNFGAFGETQQEYCERAYGEKLAPEYYAKCMRPGFFPPHTAAGKVERGLPNVFDSIAEAVRKGYQFINGAWQPKTTQQSDAKDDAPATKPDALLPILALVGVGVLILSARK